MELTTARDVTAALGGTKGVRELLPTPVSPQRVWNWRVQNKFPAKLHLLMTSALAEKGHSAPASLWGVPELERAS